MASRDLAAFRRTYPDACTADTGSKAYEAGPWLKPALTQGSFNEYQQLVGAAGANQVAAGVPVEMAQVDATSISHGEFAKIHRAIRTGRCLSMKYRSMRNPELHNRLIRPHALIQAGPRWHVRAYCAEVDGYRDFNLGRIGSVESSPDVQLPGPDADVDWLTMVRIRLVPHKALSSSQSRLVRDEYMGGTTAQVFEVRKPMARYLIQNLGAAVDSDKEAPPAYLLMVDQPEKLPKGTIW